MTVSEKFLQLVEKVKNKASTCGRKAEEITLVTVTKGRTLEKIEAVYNVGGRDFGESRLQEALQKISQLPEDCKWHLIGTLQSNKIKKALSSFCLIHSVDTPILAKKISQAAQEKGVTASILLQVNTSGEVTKHGATAKEWVSSLEWVNDLSHIKIEGLMTIAPYAADEKEIRSCFQQLHELRDQWRDLMRFPQYFHHLSMGMSHDYHLAIEEGATLLRIGTAIFGAK